MNKSSKVKVDVKELRTFICPGHDGVRLEELGVQEFHPEIAEMIVYLGYGAFVKEESQPEEADQEETVKRVDSEWSEPDENEEKEEPEVLTDDEEDVITKPVVESESKEEAPKEEAPAEEAAAEEDNKGEKAVEASDENKAVDAASNKSASKTKSKTRKGRK